jgi:hypothetical protein
MSGCGMKYYALIWREVIRWQEWRNQETKVYVTKR